MKMILGFLAAGLLLSTACALEEPAAASTEVDVAEGADAVLRCRFDPAQMEPGEVSFDWSHRSAVWDNVAIEGKSFRKRYRVDFSPSEGRYDLHIDAASYASDHGEFACRARRSGSGSVLHAETFTLTVLLRPQAPRVRPPTAPLVEGQPAQLVCSSSGGSPAPQLRWYRRGEATPLEARLTEAESREEVTESVLELTPGREDDGAQLECVAWSRAMPAEERLTASLRLNVHYYPRITVGPSNPLQVETGRAAEMTCTVDARPAVGNVRWTRHGAFINTNGTHRLETVSPSDAGVYTCSAENAVGRRSEELRLDVLYAPRVTVETERVLEEGDSAQLRCRVDANPAAERVFWLKEGDEKFRQDGPVLRLTRVTAGDDGRYICVSVNRVRGSGAAVSEERSGNSTAAVRVRHAPGAAAVLPEQPVGVEGRPLTLSCTATPPGFPTPRYRWWRRDRPDESLGTGQNLTVTAAALPSHAGHYLCSAENDLGAGSPGGAEVRVLRAPQLTSRLEERLSRPADTKSFSVSCAAQGRPRPAVLWLKDGLELQTADGKYDVTIDETERRDSAIAVRSTLNFRGWARPEDRLAAADRGNYTCRFENAAGTAETTMRLQIRHAPLIRHRFSKAAFDVGQSAVLLCQMQAFPAPDFTWWRRADGGLSPLTEAVTSGPLGDDIHQSELRLESVTTSDYGEYVCRAKNAAGDQEATLRLQPRGRPEPPTEVRAAELGTSWALLDWTPGFDGGFGATIHHVTLRDDRDRERAFDCQTRRPCNVTALQHRTTYRVRVRANNSRGDSAPSEQAQFTTLLDGSQLPAPQRAQFTAGARQITFHVLGSQLDVLGALDVRSEGGEWVRTEHQVSVANNRGRARLDDALGAVHEVRVRLCLREEPTICGRSVDAEILPAGSSLASTGRSAVTTIILVSVAATAAVALLVLLFICCCRRSSGRSTASSSAAGRNKAAVYADDDYRQKVPTGVPSHHALSAARLEALAPVGPPRPAAYESSNSNGSSTAGGSLHSQDSLWQATETGHGSTEQPTGRYHVEYGDRGAYRHMQEAAYRPLQEASYRPAEPPTEIGYARVSGLPDPYCGRLELDAPPPQPPSFDESLESGISTPSSRPRRIIREIIV